MATEAFEAFKKMAKENPTATPGGSLSNTKSSSGGSSAYQEFLKSRQPKTTPATPTPAPEQKFSPLPSYVPSPGAAPLSFGAANSTQVEPSQEQVAKTDAVVEKTKNIVNKVRALKKPENTAALRIVGSVADSSVNTGKDLINKLDRWAQSDNAREFTLTGIDFGLNAYTLGAVDFITSAAPDLIGAGTELLGKATLDKNAKQKGEQARRDVQAGFEKVLQKGLYEGVGGFVAKAAESVLGDLSEAERESLKDITTLGVMIGGFKAIERVGSARARTRAAEITASTEAAPLLSPMADVLGVDLKSTPDGEFKLPDAETLRSAYKTKLYELADEGGPLAQAKMDTLDTAYKMASDYQNLGPQVFRNKWDPIVSRGTQVADALTERVQGNMNEYVSTKSAEAVHEALTEPATKKTRKKILDLDESGQLAFESELVRMNDELNPKHVTDAGKQGYTFERISDPKDRRPAFYDVENNRIVFNEDMIRRSLDEVWKDNVIRVGEGKMTTVFRKLPNETFEQMKTRFEDVLMKHEAAHAETITPEDAAQMRAAREAGDTAKLEKLRSDLEEKANKWAVERKERIPNDMASEVDSVIRRIEDRQSGRTAKEKLVISQEVARASRREIRKMNRELSLQDKSIRRKELELLRERITRRIEKTDSKEKILDYQKRLSKVDRILSNLESTTRKKDLRLLRERITRRLEKSVLTEKFKKTEQILKDKFDNKRLAQQTVVDFMRSAGVPKDVRAKFLVAIKNAATPEDAAAILRDVKRAWIEVERKGQISKIKELMDKMKPERRQSGVYAGKMDADTQREVNQIGKLMERPRNEINKEIVEKVDQFYANNPNATELSPELAQEISRLELGGIKGQTLQQLRRTYDELYTLINTGKTNREIQLRRETRMREQMLETIREELTGDRSPRIETQVSKTALDKIKKEGWLKTIYNDSGVLSSLARQVSDKMYSLAKDTVQRQSRADLQYVRRQKQFTEKMAEIYGQDYQQEFNRIIGDQQELGVMTDKLGRQVPVRATRGYAMDLYMMLKDQYAAKRLRSENGNAFTNEMIDRMLGVLTEQDKQMADHIQSLYREDHPGVAKAYATRNGVDLGMVEGYAGPLSFETAKPVENAPTFVEELVQETNIRKSGVSPKAIKSRNGYTGRLLVNSNPITKYLVYNRRINHYIEMGDVIKKWDAIVSDQTVKNALAEKFGSSFLKSLEYQVKNVTRGSLDSLSSPTANKVAEVVSNVSQALIMNPRVVAGQFSAVSNFVAEAKSKRAFLEGVKNRKQNIELLRQYAPAVEVRLSKTPSELLATLTSETSAASRLKQKVQEKMAYPLEKADEITTLIGASGLFEDRVQFYQKKGFELEKSRQLAGRDVSEMIVRTQSGRNYLAKSQIETSSGIVSVLTQLRNQPIKTTRGMVDMLRLYEAKRISRPELASFMFWNGVVQPLAYYSSRATANVAMLGAAYVAARAIGADDAAERFQEKLKKERANFGKENAFAMVENAVGGIPLIGDLMVGLARNIAFESNQEIRPGVLSALTDDIFNVGRQWAAGDLDESALIGLRMFLRYHGLSDFGTIELFRNAFAVGNEARKKEERATPQAKMERRQKEIQKQIQKAAAR